MEIDKNFAINNARDGDMKEYPMPCPLFDLYGIFYDENTKCFWRMDVDAAKRVSGAVEWGNRYTAGGRIRFRTNAKKLSLSVRSKREEGEPSSFSPLLASCGFTLCKDEEGKGETFCARLVGKFSDITNYHVSVGLDGEWQDYILYFPLNTDVQDLTLWLDDNAELQPPKRYRDILPILYYGSSITQGGCCSRADFSYQALIAKQNQIDFVNFGFSGSALGEEEIAKYLSEQQCSLFVCDYDHNAPTVAYLEKTHYRLYEIFRIKQKDTPILFLTKPDVRNDAVGKERKRVIYNTYMRARKNGDEQVYFLNGRSFFGDKDSELCTVDGIHPNDLGFYKMAQKIYKKICQIDKKFE